MESIKNEFERETASRIKTLGERIGSLEKRIAIVEVLGPNNKLYTHDLCREFQQFLEVRGFHPGPIDGRFGPKTWQATLKLLGAIDSDFHGGA